MGRMTGRCQRGVLVVAALAFCALAGGATTFSFNPAEGTPASVINGFQAAADLWTAYLGDDVTVNVSISWTSMGGSVLGSASSTRQAFAYSAVYAALSSDITSAADATAVSHLSGGSGVNMLINYTTDNPNGSKSATPYLDNDNSANNTTVRMTTANAKALGLIDAHAGLDASITFNSDFAWDFDRSDGIEWNQFDFVGVAAHELGHALGFISGVDILDGNSPNGTTWYPEDAFTYVSTPDLFRFSAASVGYGLGTIDWTANTTAKYFSIDGGETSLATFSTGVTHGDGRQASHWKDNLGLGLMDPTFGYGELGVVTANDTLMLDVIGWDLRLEGEAAGGGEGAAAPEPGHMALSAAALWGAYLWRKSRKTAGQSAGKA